MTRLPKNPKSVLDLFLALVKIPSPSGEEKLIIDEISSWLEARSIEVSVDQADHLTGSDTGNLLVSRSREEGEKVLLLAHVDTVQKKDEFPEPTVENGVVRSKGATILGADNKAAVAALLYLLMEPQREDEADALIVFTTSEERGTMGVRSLDELAGDIRYAFPIDGSDPVGTLTTRALGFQSFRIPIKGRSAHAAKNPEEGIHAIGLASEIVSSLPLGHSSDFVLNVGRIEGGSETNIIPEAGEIFAEVRSYSKEGIEKGLNVVREKAERVRRRSGADIEIIIQEEEYVPPLEGRNNEECLRIASEAAQRVGIVPHPCECAATLEANFLDSFGIPTLGISSGGESPHSHEESIKTEELEKLAEFLREILRQAKKD